MHKADNFEAAVPDVRRYKSRLKGRLYCLVYGHDRYVVPLLWMGTCRNCGNRS